MWNRDALCSYLRDALEAASVAANARPSVGLLPTQNVIVLAEMTVEQLDGSGEIGNLTQRVIERDFGDVDSFRGVLTQSAAETDWTILGLAFGTYDFRVFSFDVDAPPFCVTPVLALCGGRDAAAAAGVSRPELVAHQLQLLNWSVIESRLTCLQQPLDLFAAPVSCATKLEV